MNMDLLSMRLRLSILGVLGVCVAGCGPKASDDDVAGTMSSSMTGGMTTGSSDGETVDTASDPTWECHSTYSEYTVCSPPGGATDGEPGSTGEMSSSSGSDTSTGSGSTDASTSSEGVTTGGSMLCEGMLPWHEFPGCGGPISEVFEQDGECCVVIGAWDPCCEGRPFFVEDVARTAAPARRSDWSCVLDDLAAPLDPCTRDEIGNAWRDDALMEHASIASFARFVLELLSLGAPASLVDEAQRALADEVQHARLAFSLAGAYLGHPVGPGPLATHDALDRSGDLVAAAVSTVREGCIGETLAAMQAELAAVRAVHPRVRDVLRQIADDEHRHALLAWRFVAWAIDRGGDAVRDAVARTFADALAIDSKRDAPSPIDLETWHAHGQLAPHEIENLRARARDAVLVPCLQALLAHPRTAQPSAGGLGRDAVG